MTLIELLPLGLFIIFIFWANAVNNIITKDNGWDDFNKKADAQHKEFKERMDKLTEKLEEHEEYKRNCDN